MVTTPYQYVESTGVIIADTSEILSGIQTEYRGVFGADLAVTSDTPQGVLIAAEALARVEVVNNNAAIANQINPNIAGGVFLDAILALTGVQRTPATQTVVTGVTLTGVAGTVISAGTQAKTAAGDVFATQAIVTLDADGNGVANFASVIYGAIPCAVNELDTIVTNILGWETVTNPVAGVLGSSTQSDQAARALRTNTLGFQGVALPVAITSALYAVESVMSLQFLENYTAAPMGAITYVTSGATLADTTWGLATTGSITVGSTAMSFFETAQTIPDINPWPTADYTTTANITLSGLSTQGGGDWSGSLTGGDIILVKNQSSAAQNGWWVADSGAWARQAYNPAASVIQGSNIGISLIASSIYVCVNGGTDLNIATALLENKSSGCGWNGGTTVAIIEPVSGQTYEVAFDRPTEIGILVKVYTTNGATANIIQAVLDYAAGLINGLAGFVVGADVSPFEISGAIITQFPNYSITKVELSYSSSVSYSVNTLVIGANEVAATQSSYITVLVV